MLTPADKKWFQESFASKKEFVTLRDGFDLLRNKVTMMSLEISNFQADMNVLRAFALRTEEKIDKLLNIMDKKRALNSSLNHIPIKTGITIGALLVR